jgi:hypothetical protein
MLPSAIQARATLNSIVICLISLSLPWFSACGQNDVQPPQDIDPAQISQMHIKNAVELLSGPYRYHGYHFLKAVASLPETRGWIDTTLLGPELRNVNKVWFETGACSADSMIRQVVARLPDIATQGLNDDVVNRIDAFCMIDRSISDYLKLKERMGDRRDMRIVLRERFQCLLSIPAARPLVEQFISDHKIDLDDVPVYGFVDLRRPLAIHLSAMSSAEQRNFISLLYACP